MSAGVAEPPLAERSPFAVPASPGADEIGLDWFSEFYQGTFDAAFNYARLLCRDSVLAEDMVSDAFLRAWLNQDSLLASRSRTGWIFTVIRNRVIDEFRARRVTVDIQELGDVVEQEQSLSLELTTRDVETIQRAIARLTEEQQQVIFLRFFQRMSHDDVALELNRNSNAVRAIQFRALSRLRSLLEAERAG